MSSVPGWAILSGWREALFAGDGSRLQKGRSSLQQVAADFAAVSTSGVRTKNDKTPREQGVRQGGTILDKSRQNILMVATGFEPVTPSVSC